MFVYEGDITAMTAANGTSDAKITNNNYDWLNSGITKPLQRIIRRNSNDVRSQPVLVDLKMIDFTHVVDENGTDENYLLGLRNLITKITTLLECHQWHQSDLIGASFSSSSLNHSSSSSP